MRVQIYTMQTVEEARAVVAQGVDHIGITPSDIGLPGEVNYATARANVDAVGNAAMRVALSVESDPDAIEGMVRAVRPGVLHLCGPVNALGQRGGGAEDRTGRRAGIARPGRTGDDAHISPSYIKVMLEQAGTDVMFKVLLKGLYGYPKSFRGFLSIWD